MSAADLLEGLGRTADGLVAIAPGGEIVAWNEGAASLLGRPAADVLGRRCFEVLRWLDRCGNAVCSPNCANCSPDGGDDVVETRDVLARSGDGKALWLSVTTLVPAERARGDVRLIHLFHEVALPPELERLVAERLAEHGPDDAAIEVDAPGAAALLRLTPREREVLALVADGLDGRDIAERLSLSLTTVRNHIQNILVKLGVHTKLEAAVLYVRHGS